MSHILVAYASRYGSTAEVAEEIGQRLSAEGEQVEVRRCGDVTSLDGFDAVVLAAPVYIGSLLKDAGSFLERHHAALEQVPVALATLGPTSKDDDMDDARQQLDGILGKHPWLKPVAAEMFIGKYDPDSLKGCDRILKVLPASPLYKRPGADDRDWAAIDAWSDGLPRLLHG